MAPVFEVGFVDKEDAAGKRGFLRTPCVLCRMHPDYTFTPGLYVVISGKLAIPSVGRKDAHGVIDPTLTQKQTLFIRNNKGSFCVILHPESVEKFGITDGEKPPASISDEEANELENEGINS